jgi:hypothetical protein
MVPSQTELNNAINCVQDALKKLRAIPKELTSNPETDELIGNAYNGLTKVLNNLNAEQSLGEN